METKQRRSPGTQQRNSRPEAAGKAKAAPGAAAAKEVPRKKPAAPAARQQERTVQTKPRRRRPAPEVVYTQPKPFSRNRLLLRLATVVAVVLALTFGISIFFKVETITVSGMEKYTAWDIREASGIQEGDNLLTFGKTRARARILAALPYVENVRVGIKLPDTVNIWVEELDVVYAIRDQSSAWWLITSEGKVVEQTDGATAGQYTQILGVLLSVPRVGEQAVAMEPVSVAAGAAEQTDETQDSASTPVTVWGSQQLDVALRIVQSLETNGIIGGVVSVDVTDLNQLELWYGNQYQVKLGDTAQLDYKISCMKEAAAQMDSYQSGVLDISFTLWPGQVVYTPFS